ncbi:MAG: response regulator transcription factor [Saprospiraceae bacterium]|nr:response regulator transcription factor [Saprospiraceae bacterium]
MDKFSCIIVEDEPLAVEILEDYIAQIPFLELKEVCPDAIFALECLNREKIDLIFLDIHLPKLKGLDFIRSLRYPPQVIIVSAYHEYAIDGYELNVLDYLLKPIEFSRFFKAVSKLKTGLPVSERPTNYPFAYENEPLFFQVDRKKVRVLPDDILFIESVGEYVKIVMTDKTMLTKITLYDIGQLLPQHLFRRIHRSYIIALKKIEVFTLNHVEINKTIIPIGRMYKEVMRGWEKG